MATLESLQQIMARPSQGQGVDREPVDLSEVVSALSGIAERLESIGSTEATETDPRVFSQNTEIIKAGQAISRAISPLSEAISSLAIPAPVVNVSPAPVTVERSRGPIEAVIRRDESGFMTSVLLREPEGEVYEEDDGAQIE